MFFSSQSLVQLVTLPEELPLTETLEFQKKLSAIGTFQFRLHQLTGHLEVFFGQLTGLNPCVQALILLFQTLDRGPILLHGHGQLLNLS